jgi:hypothetical protein
LYRRVPEEYDAQPPRLTLVLAEVISVFIDLVPESDEIHAGIPPERIARVFQAREWLHVRYRERGIRDIAHGAIAPFASMAALALAKHQAPGPIAVEELP